MDWPPGLEPGNGWHDAVIEQGDSCGGRWQVGNAAGLALADLDGNGLPEMVFMAYDDPDGGNSFRYRTGWDLHLEW